MWIMLIIKKNLLLKWFIAFIFPQSHLLLKYFKLEKNESLDDEELDKLIRFFVANLGAQFYIQGVIDSYKYIVEDGKIRLPFASLAGVGVSAAQSLKDAAKDGEYLSIDDVQIRSKVTKAVIETLQDAGILKDLPESNQMSFF